MTNKQLAEKCVNAVADALVENKLGVTKGTKKAKVRVEALLDLYRPELPTNSAIQLGNSGLTGNSEP